MGWRLETINNMSALILNREWKHPEDGWYMIEPKGEHPNRAGGVVQVIDQEAMQSICNRFAAEAAAPGFAGMLIDHEHFRHNQDKETVAYGWLVGLSPREDGLYAQVRWTNTGRAAVDGGDYRFFSTEYNPKDCAILNRDGRRMRPLRLDGLTLTNDPNNKGQRPITNRGNEFRQAAGAVLAGSETTTKKDRSMKSVATMLGLSAEASEDAVLAAVTTLNNRMKKAEADVAPLTNRVTALAAENKALLGAQVEADLDKYKNRFKAEKREGWKAALLTNRASTLELLDGLPEPVVAAAAAAPGGAVLNRAGTQTPATTAAADPEKATADKILNRARDLQKSGMKFAEAFGAATTELLK